MGLENVVITLELVDVNSRLSVTLIGWSVVNIPIVVCSSCSVVEISFGFIVDELIAVVDV